MSYKTEFQSNNTDLQAILDAVNNLPDAGGSSTKLVISSTGGYTLKVYYRSFDGTSYEDTTVSYGDEITLTLNDGWFVIIVANEALYMCAQTEKGVDSTIKYSSSTMYGTNCTPVYVYNIQ